MNSDGVLYDADKSNSTGLFISQNIESWSLAPYIGYPFYDYDTGPASNGLTLEKVDVWNMGARIASDLTVQ